MQELGIYLRIVDLSDTKHIFYECSRLHRIIGIHLLEGREIASGKIETLDAVIAIDGNFRIIESQLPFAADAPQHHHN
jgi:hypothetical protein